MTKYLCKLLGCSCPDPQPVSCRGIPRTQFKRHFVLIHSSVSENISVTIFKQAKALGRTVGFSADDAGMGDLDIKIVYAYGWPDFSALLNFFNTYYPGTEVIDMPLPLSEYFLVADVSSSGQGIVSRNSYRLMREKGVKGVYIRGPRGAAGMDTAIQQNYLNALDEGLLVGMYGVWHPNDPVTEQVQSFITVYKSFIWDFPPAGDFELSGGQNVAQNIEQYLALIDAAIEPTPLVYTRATWWNENVGDTLWAKKYPLWVAAYPNPQGAWHLPSAYADRYTPMGWSTWKIWQFGILTPEQFALTNAQGLDMNWLKV